MPERSLCSSYHNPSEFARVPRELKTRRPMQLWDIQAVFEVLMHHRNAGDTDDAALVAALLHLHAACIYDRKAERWLKPLLGHAMGEAVARLNLLEKRTA